MRTVGLLCVLVSTVSLRMITSSPYLQPTGNIGGMSGAYALCRAMGVAYAANGTTWMPLLETSPPTFRSVVEGYGSSIYPYTDAVDGHLICSSDMFVPGAIKSPLINEGQKFTGYGTVGTCSNWTTKSGQATMGTNILGDSWLNYGPTSCSYKKGIVCLEVPLEDSNFAPPVTMFVTSLQYLPNVGGLTGADAICNSRAASSPWTSSRGGRWYALLSDSKVSLSSRIKSTMSSRGLRLLGPQVVATIVDHLFMGNDFGVTGDPFAYTETKVLVTGFSDVWTGATSQGGSHPSNCNGWTVASGAQGEYGRVNTNDQFLAYLASSCINAKRFYCMQYFSPIVVASASILSPTSRVSVTVTLYQDITWSKVRCVVSPAFITNETVFWGYSSSNPTLGVLEAMYSGFSTVSLTSLGMATNTNFYVTCAAASNVDYTALTWFTNVTGPLRLPAPPAILQAQSNVTNSRVTAAVITNVTGTYRMRCALRTVVVTLDALWTAPLGPMTIEVISTGTGLTPNFFVFSGLLSNTKYYISCAHYISTATADASTPAASLSLSTLPKCADGSGCPVLSMCMDSTDGSLFQCSPYIDGGLHIASTAAPLCTSAGGSASALTLTTTAGEFIEFCVQVGIRTDLSVPNVLSVTYGPSSRPQRFNCASVSLSLVVSNVTRVKCRTSLGLGGLFNLSLVYQGRAIIGQATISYPLPVIVSNTLRLASENGTGTTNLAIDDTLVGALTFRVENIQLLPELTIYYGDSGNPNMYICTLDDRTTSTAVFCTLSPLTEFRLGGYFFTVDAGGQRYEGTDVVTLPAGRPILEGVNCSACSAVNGGGLENCPTVGNTIDAPAVLTIFGRNFPAVNGLFRAFVDGTLCTVKSRVGDVAQCMLPEGAGFGRGLFVQSDSFFSAPKSWISYAAPSVSEICGCSVPCSDPAKSVKECSRAGGQTLQIFGANFGAVGASVLVGVDACLNVRHDSNFPHSQLSCTLPRGSGLDRPILVIQGNGAASVDSGASVSYTQCGEGTYQNGNQVVCANCSAGTFSSLKGLSSCTPCSPGSMMNASGATVCFDCEPGRYQPSSARTECIACQRGTVSDTPGRTGCGDCPLGKFMGQQGQSLCNDCAAGFYQPSIGQTECLACTVGKFQGTTAQSSCLPCQKGWLAPEANLTACVSCAAGSYQSDAGGSRCDYCVPGRFVGSEGASDCLPCPAGSFSDEAGAIECKKCEAGSAQISSGQSGCATCTSGRFASTQGSASCELCPLGSIAPGSGWNSTCVTCPAKATPADTLCACSPGHEWTGSDCMECVVGQDCSRFGVVRGEAVALAGFLRVGNESAFQSCLVSTYCPGGMTSCAPFREGPLCQLCIAGYREDNAAVDGSCSACPSRQASVGNIAVVGVILVAVLVFLYYIVVRSGMRSLITPVASTKSRPWWDSLSHDSVDPSIEVSESKPPPNEVLLDAATKEKRVERTLSYQLKIVITFVQLSTSALALSTLSLPPTFRTFLGAFDFVNLNFIPWNYVGCLARYTLLTKILVTAIAPLVLLPVAGSLLFVVLKIMDSADHADNDSSRNSRAKYRAVFWKVTLFTVFLAYPAVSRQIFSYFRCVEVLQPGQPPVYLLRESFEEECYDDAWYSKLPAVVFLILAYPLGVPLGLGSVLRHYHPRFHEKYLRYSLGFAFEGFVSEFWYFELLDMIHKLLVASFVSLLPPTAQVPIAMAILGLYLCVLSYCQPYVRKADNQLHLLTQVALYLLVFSFLARDKTGPVMSGSEEDVLLSTLMIFIFISVLVFYLFRMVQFYRLAYLARRRRILKAKLVEHESSIDLSNDHTKSLDNTKGLSSTRAVAAAGFK